MDGAECSASDGMPVGGGWQGKDERDVVGGWEVVRGGCRFHYVNIVDRGEGRDWPEGEREATWQTQELQSIAIL